VSQRESRELRSYECVEYSNGREEKVSAESGKNN